MSFAFCFAYEPSHRRKPQTIDYSLLPFKTYEDYLDSLYTSLDECYLEDKQICRKIAEYGFRKDSETFSKEEFEKKKQRVLDYLTPVRINELASQKFRYGDLGQNALAIRERANKAGLLSTIIFVSFTPARGNEVSGYIDYAHSLLKKDWNPFFKDNSPIIPDRFDLGFYDWKNGITKINNSLYFKTLMTPHRGLVFQHKFDRILIVPDPYAASPGPQTTRTRVKSKMYNTLIIIDHITRSRK